MTKPRAIKEPIDKLVLIIAIGITTKTHGRNPFTFKVNYNQNQTINNSGESTERNHTHNLSNTISFRKSGGFTIPIFFFRDFHIDNDLDFNITFSFEESPLRLASIRRCLSELILTPVESKILIPLSIGGL